jgi:two-component system NtrC family response regulator
MKVLIVEDEHQQAELIKTIIDKFTQHHAQMCHWAEDALALINKYSFDIVISDWKLPGMDGLALLERVKQAQPELSFILVTAYGSISHAISSIRAGADDYIAKPFEKDQLLFTLNKIVRSRQLSEENQQLKQQTLVREKLGEIVGSSPKMQQLYHQIDKVSNANIHVLIHGESGTGKELVARALHQRSERASNLFLPVNCSAIPESLAEAELFGAEKGAYTGAHQKQIGKIEAAHRGTLFLDEIAELPLSLQPKLLRFLQEGKIMRVGGNQEIQVDVRVIAATHKNLATKVKRGNFREDLYYRLNVVPLSLPALRERIDDLPELTRFFIQKFADKHQCEPIKLSKSVLNKMFNYPWPGNIRELSNLIERLTVLKQGEAIELTDIPDKLSSSSNQHHFRIPDQGMDWEEHERNVLQQALSRCGNNRTQAAQLLGLNYKAFLYRLEKYRIKIPK